MAVPVKKLEENIRHVLRLSQLPSIMPSIGTKRKRSETSLVIDPQQLLSAARDSLLKNSLAAPILSMYGGQALLADAADRSYAAPADPHEAEDVAAPKKPRFVWSSELHRRFEDAVRQLGIDAAKPQAISQLMGEEGENAPSRQNIKSHLQKYRQMVKKRAAVSGGGMKAFAFRSSHKSTARGGMDCEDPYAFDDFSLANLRDLPVGAIFGGEERHLDFDSDSGGLLPLADAHK
uniref:HTH myb-type domain-containing protein n=1 Tax=Calcidiscus leptoporus TaxID=127549 RepID=A0A7S0J6B9_9EUKA